MSYTVNYELDRAGYKVTKKQIKIWEIELGLAKKLLDVCRKYDIKIYMWAGTLLGAVRHKGFIPWDDDMDFAMERNEFQRLIEHANEFKSPFFLQYALNDRRYFFDYARLRRSDTTGVITWNKSREYNNGIFVDIFVLDGIPKNELFLNLFLMKRQFLRKIIHSYYKDIIRKDNSGRIPVLSYVFHLISKLNTYDGWYDIYNKHMSSYTEESERISLMTHNKDFIKKYFCNKEFVKECIELEFENCKLPAISKFHELLKNTYGDYMKYPPIELRGKWHESSIIFEPDIPYYDYLKN